MLVTPQVPGWLRDILPLLGVFVVGKLWLLLGLVPFGLLIQANPKNENKQ